MIIVTVFAFYKLQKSTQQYHYMNLIFKFPFHLHSIQSLLSYFFPCLCLSLWLPINNIQQQINNKMLKSHNNVYIYIHTQISNPYCLQAPKYAMYQKSTKQSQKQNQQKFVNKKTDLLTSLNNIKLPLQAQGLGSQPSLAFNGKENQFMSVGIHGLQGHRQEERETGMYSYREGQENGNRGSKVSRSSKDSKDVKQKKINDVCSTEEYCLSYGQEIQQCLGKELVKGKFLANHKIDAILRARMLDWMIQVMSSYHFQNKTYFSAVEIMDRFFQSSSQQLPPSQLHIIGVQSMFLASKMQQIYPLKLKTVHQKIAHKKIPISQLLAMQAKIAQTLSFSLVSATLYDLAIAKLSVWLAQIGKYSEQYMKQIQQYIATISRIISYNYELIASYPKQQLCLYLISHVLQLCNPNLAQLWQSQSQCNNHIHGQSQKQIKQAIKDSILNFRKKYKGLGNLFKFTDKKTIDALGVA